MSREDISYFLKDLKHRIQSQYISRWYAAINDSNKNPILRSYCLFKSEFVFEKYLNCKIPSKYKRLITQLRVSSHQLRVETGRHQRPYIPPEKRFCIFCKAGISKEAIDDEKHFIMNCEFHNNERLKLLSSIKDADKFLSRDVRNNDILFNYIMCSKDQNIIVALGKFIEAGIKKRK